MVMQVGLVFGGRSGEHEVSIRSAGAIANALSTDQNRTKYAVVPVLIRQRRQLGRRRNRKTGTSFW